jgi:hypothetical protein
MGAVRLGFELAEGRPHDGLQRSIEGLVLSHDAVGLTAEDQPVHPGGPRGRHLGSDLVARVKAEHMGPFDPQRVHEVNHAAGQVADLDVGRKGIGVAGTEIVRRKGPVLFRHERQELLVLAGRSRLVKEQERLPITCGRVVDLSIWCIRVSAFHCATRRP